MDCTLRVKKTRERDGIAKRIDRTIAERVRCVLFDGNQPKQLRAEATVTEAYCVNLPERMVWCRHTVVQQTTTTEALKSLRLYCVALCG